jgi:hypothetical protein
MVTYHDATDRWKVLMVRALPEPPFQQAYLVLETADEAQAMSTAYLYGDKYSAQVQVSGRKKK